MLQRMPTHTPRRSKFNALSGEDAVSCRSMKPGQDDATQLTKTYAESLHNVTIHLKSLSNV
jgi:hypothetical protein